MCFFFFFSWHAQIFLYPESSLVVVWFFFFFSSQIVGKTRCLHFLHGRKYLHLLQVFLSLINKEKLLTDSVFQQSKHKLSVLLWVFFMAKFGKEGIGEWILPAFLSWVKTETFS